MALDFISGAVDAITGIGNLFKTSDAEWNYKAVCHQSDRTLDAVRDTNQTSTRNLQMVLNYQNQSEIRNLNFAEDWMERSSQAYDKVWERCFGGDC